MLNAFPMNDNNKKTITTFSSYCLSFWSSTNKHNIITKDLVIMIICKVICSNFKSDLFDLLKHAKIRHVRMFLGEGTCITAGGYLFIAETGPIIISLNTPRRYCTGVMSRHSFDYDCLFVDFAGLPTAPN